LSEIAEGETRIGTWALRERMTKSGVGRLRDRSAQATLHLVCTNPLSTTEGNMAAKKKAAKKKVVKKAAKKKAKK
jgi:hypothetical protein